VVAKVRERLAVNKQRRRFYMERFNLKKLKEVEDIAFRSQIDLQLLEDVDAEMEINSA
jgi:hypothetical protein